MSMFLECLNAWGLAMWHASWQGGLAVLVVWSICWLLPAIPARFQAWLWRLALLKFLAALVWWAPIELPLLPPPEAPAWESNGPLFELASSGAGVAASELQTTTVLSPWLLLFAVWIAVVGWQSGLLLRAFGEAARLRRGCRPSENRPLLQLLARLSGAAGLRPPPALLEMDGQGSPLLVGICRPAMVLPAGSVSRLDESERSLVIGHELAHLLRGDLFWGLVASVVRTVFCFHPLAWLAERQTRLTQEMAADELAISLERQDPVRYATLLVSIVSKIAAGPQTPALSVGVAGAHWSLERRLSAMRFVKPVSLPVVLAYSLVLSASALLGIVPWAIVAAAAPDKPAPKEATYSGKLASFKDGLLTIKTDDGQDLSWKVAEETKTVTIIRGVEKEGIARETFKLVERGIAITVKTQDEAVVFLQFGVKPGPAADKPAADKPADKPAPNKAAQKHQRTWGRYVSFQNGVLTLESNAGALIRHEIPKHAQFQVWNHEQNVFQPAETAVALKQLEPKISWLVVRPADDQVTVQIGSRKSAVVGTFVSYKNDRLLLLGKNIGEAFVKKYGNSLHFNRFRDDVQAYESIDGGEYKLIGPANKVLGNVKEGTILTVHGEGDDNITLVQIGLPNKS